MLSFKYLLSIILIIQINLCYSSITEEHKFKFKSLFNLDQKIDSSTLPNLYYSLNGLNILHNENINAAFQSSEKKTALCDKIKKFMNDKANQQLDNLYFTSSSFKILNCQFDTAQFSSIIESFINEQSTVLNLYRYVITLENCGKQIQSAKISKLLTNALSKDQSYLSAGLSLQIASKLSRNDQIVFINKIPNLIKKADEVSGKYLQYEGGLGVTTAIIKGIFDLSIAANKDTGLTSQQITKFVNYFFNRLTVQSPKGAFELLFILKLLSNNKLHIPVIVSLYGSNVVNEDNSNVVLRVTNTFGTSLAKEFKVTAKLDGISDVFKFSAVSGDSTLYAIDFLETKKLPANKYNLKISVEPIKVEKQLVINNDISFTIVVQSGVNLDSIEIGLGLKDEISIKHEPVEYPASLKNKLECDYNQKISIKYCVRNPIQSRDITVQQSLIYFQNDQTKQEIIYVADQDRLSKVYNKDINLAYRGKDFNYQSGDYTIRLVVGDQFITQPINYVLAKVNIQFNQDLIEDVSSNWLNRYQERPEIVHEFRKPEKRPPEFVSNSFTLLSLLPVLILFICWRQLGLNLSDFKFSLSAILFHGSLILVFALYTLFFIRLNMFTTLKCLSGVIVTLFLSGYYLLREKKLKSN